MRIPRTAWRTICGMLWRGPSILFLAVSKRLFRHPSTDAWHSPWARILLGLPCFACVPHGAVEGPFVACFGTVLLLLLAVSKRLFRHPSTDAWHSPWARILLGFPCFACVPHGAVEGPFVACFGTVLLLLVAVSKRLLGIPGVGGTGYRRRTRHLMPGILDHMACGVALALPIGGGAMCRRPAPGGQKNGSFLQSVRCA